MKKQIVILSGIIVVLAILVAILAGMLVKSELEPGEEKLSTQTAPPKTTSTLQPATQPPATEVPNTVDRDFLEAMERALETRDDMVGVEDSWENLGKAVDAELRILSEFKNADFEDTELRHLAKQYIAGLNTQKKALEKNLRTKCIEWQEGMVARFEAICSLESEYDLFADDKYFRSIYTEAELEKAQYTLKGMKAISQDMEQQLLGGNVSANGPYALAAAYKNNTKYTFDVTIYCIFQNYRGESLEPSTNNFTNITPGEEGYFVLDCPYLTTVKSIRVDWQISNIK